jgi:hypothetical protein
VRRWPPSTRHFSCFFYCVEKEVATNGKTLLSPSAHRKMRSIRIELHLFHRRI